MPYLKKTTMAGVKDAKANFMQRYDEAQMICARINNPKYFNGMFDVIEKKTFLIYFYLIGTRRIRWIGFNYFK